jgi:tetratricopeptide (TPR) repeat protein
VVPALIVLCDRCLAAQTWRRAAWRNLPFVAISLGAIVLKVASRTGGASKTSQFGSRLDWLATTIVTYGQNVGSLFTSMGRNVLYVNEPIRSLSDPRFLGGVAALIVTLVLLVAFRGRRLWIFALLWFLFALIPTSQVARHHIVRADRYLYLPGIGACLMGGLTFAWMWGWSRRILWKIPVCLVGLLIAARFAVGSQIRAFDWCDDATLWTSSLAQDERNSEAHHSLGGSLMRQGKTEEALRHLHRAIEVQPNHPEAHNTLGALLLTLGRTDEAIAEASRAVEVRPDYPEARFNLARACQSRGRLDQAAEAYRAGLSQRPEDIGAWYYLGQTLVLQGRLAEAIRAYERALSLNATYVEARYGLALALIRSSQADRARDELTTLVRSQPEFAEAHCRLADLARRRRDYADAAACYRAAIAARPGLREPRIALARLLATCPQADVRNGAEAVSIARPLSEGPGLNDPQAWDVLAAALAESGDFAGAVDAARRAANLAAATGRGDLTADIRSRLERYRAGRPCREP